jgi:hypothetical protein
LQYFSNLFQLKDCDFDDLEKRFSYLSRYIQLFTSDVQHFRKQLHESVICQFNVAQNVADLYRERVHTREVERFRSAHKNILATHWNEFVRFSQISTHITTLVVTNSVT